MVQLTLLSMVVRVHLVDLDLAALWHSEMVAWDLVSRFFSPRPWPFVVVGSFGVVLRLRRSRLVSLVCD